MKLTLLICIFTEAKWTGVIFAEHRPFLPAPFLAFKCSLKSNKPLTPNSVWGNEDLLWPITQYNSLGCLLQGHSIYPVQALCKPISANAGVPPRLVAHYSPKPTS